MNKTIAYFVRLLAILQIKNKEALEQIKADQDKILKDIIDKKESEKDEKS